MKHYSAISLSLRSATSLCGTFKPYHRKSPPGWSWKLPSTLHLTTFYYREGLGRAELETIHHHLSLPLHEPFTAQPQGLGVFANRPQSILFAGISPMAERALTFLHRYQCDYLGAFRNPERVYHSYVPHITLAEGPHEHVAEAIDIVHAHCSDIWPSFEATHLELFSKDEDGRSRVVKSYPLREVEL